MEERELLESYAQTPFYQEFTVTFTDESLGLEVQKVHDCPVVRRLLRPSPTWMGQAEKGGVSIGSLLSNVGSLQTTSMSYDDVLKKIKSCGRPVELTFRRLHAISDPGICIGRLWQGFLRTWTGKESGHWTGRFYLLCANGDLQAFIGTDPDSMANPVDQFSVVGCPVLWGKQAKESATEHGLMLGNDWEDIFAIQPANLDHAIPLFFKATGAESRCEWVGALATLEVSLTVSVGTSSDNESKLSFSIESSSVSSSGGAVSTTSDIKNRTRKPRANSIDPLAYWPPLTVLKHSLAEKGDRSVFSSENRQGGVMGNLLASSPKWTPICLLLLPGKATTNTTPGGGSSSSSSHPRLCWYHKAPSNANELPSGEVLLWGVRLANLSEDQRVKSEPVVSSSSSTSKSSSDKHHDLNDGGTTSGGGLSGGGNEDDDGIFKLDHGALGFILYAANRIVRLRFHYVAECQEWAKVLMAVSDTSDTFMPSSSSSSSSSLNHGYESRLIFYQQACESVLRGCNDVIPLLAGGAYRLAETQVKKSSTSSSSQPPSPTVRARSPTTKKKYSISLSTAILRRDFNTVGAQYLLPLCDVFTSDIIFEALTEHCRLFTSSQSTHLSKKKTQSSSMMSPSKSQSIAIQAGKILGDIAGSVGGDKRKFDLLDNGDRLLRSIPATPLDMGISLPYKTLKQYCTALDIVTRPDESWELLRMKIGLEASEILIRVDEKVTCIGEEVVVEECIDDDMIAFDEMNNTPSSSASTTMSSNTTTDISKSNSSNTPLDSSSTSSSKQSYQQIDVKNNNGDTNKKSKHRARVEWMEIGTMYVTDRNLIFLRKGRLTTYRGFETTSGSRPVARILPLNHIEKVIDLGRSGLLLPKSYVINAHLDEQVVTEDVMNVTLNFSSCRSSSLFGKSEFSIGEELKAIGGGRIRALQRIIRESLSELIASHQIMASLSDTSSSSPPSSSSSVSPSSSSSSNLQEITFSSSSLLKTVASRRRGVSAMLETIRTAIKLGPKEVWCRGCGAELTESELWEIEVKTHALSIWTALNLKRRSALMRVTGLTLTSLLLCSKYKQFYIDKDMVNTSSKNDIRSKQAHTSMKLFLQDLQNWRLNKNTINMECSDWLLYTAKWLTNRNSRIQRALIPIETAKLLKGTPSFEGHSGKKREEAMKLRAAYSEAFNPSDFRDNWQLFMSYLDPFVDNFVDVLPGTFMHSLLHWDDPFISFGVMVLLLSIAYHDLVYLFPSICLLSYALFLLISGSTIAATASEELMQNKLRKESTRKALLLSNNSTAGGVTASGGVSSSSSHESSSSSKISPTSPFLISSRFSSRSQSMKEPDPTVDMVEMKRTSIGESSDSTNAVTAPNGTSSSSAASSSLSSSAAGSEGGGDGSGYVMRNISGFDDNDCYISGDLDDDQVLAIAAAAAARSRFTTSNSMRESNTTTAADLFRDKFQSQLNTVTKTLSGATTPTTIPPPPPPPPPNNNNTSSSDTETVGIDGAIRNASSSSSSSSSSSTVTALQSQFHNDSESSGEEEDVEDEELKEIAQNVVPLPLPTETQQVTDEKDEKEGLVEFMRQMRAHLGRMQLHLHRYNKYYLRWQALHLWRDQPSSWILFLVLFLGATWLAIIPHNITFAMGTFYAFARPIRKPKRSKGFLSLFDAMLYQWLDGIPLEAPTHRSTSIAVQMTMVKSLNHCEK